MIEAQLKIGELGWTDSTEFGLVFISADTRFEAPLKEMEKTSYPEQEGENILGITTRNAFDYKIEWFVDAREGLANANQIIAAFNSTLYTRVGDMLSFLEVGFKCPYKGVEIWGVPSLISDATEFWRCAGDRRHDVVKVEWIIRVTKPNKCRFNIRG